MSWNHACLEIILSDRTLKVWIVDDSLIPTEKFLQRGRGRVESTWETALSLIGAPSLIAAEPTCVL